MLKENMRGKSRHELLTSIQEVVNAFVFPQGREVEVVHQCIQAILEGRRKMLPSKQT